MFAYVLHLSFYLGGQRTLLSCLLKVFLGEVTLEMSWVPPLFLPSLGSASSDFTNRKVSSQSNNLQNSASVSYQLFKISWNVSDGGSLANFSDGISPGSSSFLYGEDQSHGFNQLRA